MKKNRRIAVKSVCPGSIAEEAGIEQGDFILHINNKEFVDIFDYRMLTADEELILEVEKPDGEVWEIDIEKDQYEDLGIEFEDGLIAEAKSCTNKCIFCFIDQLPRGMRETLYFKDDDSRLSFLTGNYVTLTNMKQSDIDRIIRYRMSPINVSVHTTNPDLRKMMLGNRFAGDVAEKIKRLVDNGIRVNCQIVLCRNINDGEELDRTIRDLSAMLPGIESTSVVPVGLTKWREGLYNLIPFDSDSAAKVVDQVENWQKILLEKYGTRFVYLADEFYLMAGRQLPPYEAYEDFPQIENGVGLLSSFKYEFDDYIGRIESEGIDAGKAAGKDSKCNADSVGDFLPATPIVTSGRIEGGCGREISIATGVSAYNFIKGLAEELEKRYNNLKVNVFEIKNHFFGENVTVAGLLTGADIFNALKGRELGTELLLARSMFRSGEEVFLDDVTLDRLQKELGVKAVIVDNNGIDFIDKVLGI